MKITDDVLGVLSALEISGKVVRIAEQIERKLYTKTNKVLEAIGGKWSRAAKAHLFPIDPVPRLDLVITTGEVETGQDVGFFETPQLLAKELVEMAGVQRGWRVLEPSAGRGRIVVELQEAGALVTAIEWDQERRLYLAEKVLKGRDVLVPTGDCMTWTDGPVFDAVVMNPPFCKSGEGDHIDHVRHCYTMLKPGGVLVSVLPSSVEFRRDRRYREFRAWLLDSGTISPLPAGAFKSSGTGVNTVVARIVR